MEITGFGTAFIVDVSFKERVARFIRLQCERWPSLYFNGVPVAEAFGSAWRPSVDPEAEDAECLAFSSGAEMEDFWEQNGYALDANGEGPFCLFYKYYQSWIGAQLQSIDAEEYDGAMESAALGAELRLSEFFLVSIVTPERPAEDEFSRSVVEDFRRIIQGECQ
ncbi:hypothetical protein [Kitasatospora acidiphila]|uniref:hypothetical protein n=1 Tax=Kitasatospora acidiphila TaxID=2567942 RepID=UPI003C7064E7